jgi:hypothetical protein
VIRRSHVLRGTLAFIAVTAALIFGPTPSARADPPEPRELLAPADRAAPGEDREPCGPAGWVGDGENGRDPPGCDADADLDDRAASLGGRAGPGGLDDEAWDDGPEPGREP